MELTYERAPLAADRSAGMRPVCRHPGHQVGACRTGGYVAFDLGAVILRECAFEEREDDTVVEAVRVHG
jgi:hypothetical protein